MFVCVYLSIILLISLFVSVCVCVCVCVREREITEGQLKVSVHLKPPHPTPRQWSTRTTGPDVGSRATTRLIGLIAGTLLSGV